MKPLLAIIDFFRKKTSITLGTIVLLLTLGSGYYIFYKYNNVFSSTFPQTSFLQNTDNTSSSGIVKEYNQDRSNWGAMGDYFGGLLNPLVAFSALILIYINIVMTHKEFKETRKLISQQLKTQSKQRFEDTFFSILEQHNTTLNVVRNKEYRFKWYQVNSPKEARECLWKDIDEKHHEIQTYFRVLYQILKFIDSNDIEDKKTYSNLVRSFLDSHIGELVLINSLHLDNQDTHSFKRFKDLIEKYAFLEHVDISTPMDKLESAKEPVPSLNVTGSHQETIDQKKEKERCEGLIKRFEFYKEITKERQDGQYYSEKAYGDCRHYKQVQDDVAKYESTGEV